MNTWDCLAWYAYCEASTRHLWSRKYGEVMNDGSDD